MDDGTTTSYVTAAGHRLHLPQIAGERPGAPTLVFPHEGLGTVAIWGDFPGCSLSRDRLARCDLRAPGLRRLRPRPSPWPDDVFEQEAEIVLPALLEGLGIDPPVVIGHSDGGTIALLYAAAFPERACGVVTLAAHVVLDELTLAGLLALERSWRKGDLRRELERVHGANAVTLFRAWSELWLDPARRAWSILDRLPLIICPVLAIQGAQDEYGLPGQLDAIVDGVSGPAQRGLASELRARPTSSGA